MEPTSAADIQMLEEAIGNVFAPWVRELGLRVVAAQPGEVQLDLPVRPGLVHAGGVLCGQALMAAADSGMVLAVMTRLGGFKPMTTVQLQTSFIRPLPGDATHARLAARVLKLGKNLVFGEILVHTPAGELAAQTTTTYALL